MLEMDAALELLALPGPLALVGLMVLPDWSNGETEPVAINGKEGPDVSPEVASECAFV